MKKALKDFVKLGAFPFLVYFTNDLFTRFLLTAYDNYHLDTYFHFIGGLSIATTAYFFLAMLEQADIIIIKRKLAKAFLIIVLVMSAAVLWEIYEFFWDLHFGTHMQPNNFDTMKDMIMGTLGGITFCFKFFLGSKAADGARERDTLPDVLSAGNPAYDTLETDAKTRMRD